MSESYNLLSAISTSTFNSAFVLPTNETLLQMILHKRSLELILSHSNFEDELTSQDDYFIDYFSSHSIIKELLRYIIVNDNEYSSTFPSIFSFNSFRVLSLCSPKITLALFSSQHLLNNFLNIINMSNRHYSTCQGYFLGICKNLMNKEKVQREIFIVTFENQKKQTLYPLVENLTVSNAILIKILLLENSGLSKVTRYQIFNYLIFYYMNLKFEENKKIEFDELAFDNLISVFRFLISEKVNYEYKSKYLDVLFNEKTITSKLYYFRLYSFRVIIIKYIAQMNQIKKIDHPGSFLKKILDVSNRFKKNCILLDALATIELVSKNNEFESHFDAILMDQLFEILITKERADIIHKKIFNIFENYSQIKNKKLAVQTAFCMKLLESLKKTLTTKVDMIIGKTSLCLFASLLKMFDTKMLESDLRMTFENAKKKLEVELVKFEISHNVSFSINDQSQAIQLLKSTDDINQFLHGMESENNYANEKNILIVSADVLDQRFKFTDNNKELNKQANQELQNLLVSQDLRPVVSKGSKEELDNHNGESEGDVAISNQLFSPRNSQILKKKAKN